MRSITVYCTNGERCVIPYEDTLFSLRRWWKTGDDNERAYLLYFTKNIKQLQEDMMYDGDSIS